MTNGFTRIPLDGTVGKSAMICFGIACRNLRLPVKTENTTEIHVDFNRCGPEDRDDWHAMWDELFTELKAMGVPDHLRGYMRGLIPPAAYKAWKQRKAEPSFTERFMKGEATL